MDGFSSSCLANPFETALLDKIVGNTRIFLPRAVGFLCGSKKILNPICLTASARLLMITSSRRFQSINVADLLDPGTGPRVSAVLSSSPKVAPALLVGLRRRPADFLLGLLIRFCTGNTGDTISQAIDH
jgi:hypothetical protein